MNDRWMFWSGNRHWYLIVYVNATFGYIFLYLLLRTIFCGVRAKKHVYKIVVPGEYVRE